MRRPDVALRATALRLPAEQAKAEVSEAEHGATSFDKNGMPVRVEVPCDLGDDGIVVRLHEARHAALGPLVTGALESRHSPFSVQALEDMLIQRFMFPREFQAEAKELAKREKKLAKQLLANAGSPPDLKRMARLMLARAFAIEDVTVNPRGYPSTKQLREVLQWAYDAVAHVGEGVGKWDRTYKAYSSIEKALRILDEYFEWTPPPPPPRGEGLDQLSDLLRELRDESRDWEIDKAVPFETLDAMVDAMKISELEPRSMPTQLAKMRRKYRARSGRKMDPKRLPRAMASRSVDGLFIRRRKAEGAIGAVLIDASGSMDVSNELLQEMVVLAPGATIAYYFGHGDFDGSRGALHIIAREGKLYVGGPQITGGGNSVDYWALKWLLEQPGPRVYVGDLGFTGGPAGQARAAHMLFDAAMRTGAIAEHHHDARMALAAWQEASTRKSA